jgi:hypothetical protein
MFLPALHTTARAVHHTDPVVIGLTVFWFAIIFAAVVRAQERERGRAGEPKPDKR